jgi:hypothetical protein
VHLVFGKAIEAVPGAHGHAAPLYFCFYPMKVAVERFICRAETDEVIALLILHYPVETEIVHVANQKATALSGNQVRALLADPHLLGSPRSL